MLELTPDQIILKLSAVHLKECREWKREVEAQWRSAQLQDQAQTTSDVPPMGAIGGTYSYTIRPIGEGYHLNVQDALSGTERAWSATATPSDFVVFATLFGHEYQRLSEWFAQGEYESFERWLKTELAYQFCDTTLGRITRVQVVNTGARLDLTEYEAW